jgi:predicted DNA-binding transcriptional regulator YafY
MPQKYKPQHRRLTFIDQQISTGGYPNCFRMSQEWEVSPKTIQRDVDYLRDELGAPIQYSALRRGFFYTEPTWRLPAIQLSEGDLFSISIAERVLEQYENTSIRESLKAIFDKIRQALPAKVSAADDWLSPRISIRSSPTTIIEKAVWQAVMIALRENRKLRIAFQGPGYNSAISRILNPYHLLGYAGEWYLIASDSNARGQKTYGLSRIKSATALEERFAMPMDFKVRDYLKNSFGIIRGDKNVAVRLRFSDSQAPYVAERTWMEGQKIRKLRSGEIILSFEASNLYEVQRWVLSWGEDVTVLGPKKLVEGVKKTLRTAAQLYR